MARFHRRGHWRTSKSGNTHWVTDHSVTRDSSRAATFSRDVGSSTTGNWWERTLPSGAAGRFYSTPNATCPICGVKFFFYSNSYGGKVYFDSLGPPWPKHACMDVEHVRDELRSVASHQPWKVTQASYLGFWVLQTWHARNRVKFRIGGGGYKGPTIWTAPRSTNMSVGMPVFLRNVLDRKTVMSFVDNDTLVVTNVRVRVSWITMADRLQFRRERRLSQVSDPTKSP